MKYEKIKTWIQKQAKPVEKVTWNTKETKLIDKWKRKWLKDQNNVSIEQ